MSTKSTMCSTEAYVSYESPTTVWMSIHSAFTRIVDMLKARAEGRKGVKQLSKLDDRMLKDIGLIRADVERLMLSHQPEKSLQALNRHIRR